MQNCAKPCICIITRSKWSVILGKGELGKQCRALRAQTWVFCAREEGLEAPSLKMSEAPELGTKRHPLAFCPMRSFCQVFAWVSTPPSIRPWAGSRGGEVAFPLPSSWVWWGGMRNDGGPLPSPCLPFYDACAAGAHGGNTSRWSAHTVCQKRAPLHRSRRLRSRTFPKGACNNTQRLSKTLSTTLNNSQQHPTALVVECIPMISCATQLQACARSLERVWAGAFQQAAQLPPFPAPSSSIGHP